MKQSSKKSKSADVLCAQFKDHFICDAKSKIVLAKTKARLDRHRHKCYWVKTGSELEVEQPRRILLAKGPVAQTKE